MDEVLAKPVDIKLLTCIFKEIIQFKIIDW